MIGFRQETTLLSFIDIAIGRKVVRLVIVETRNGKGATVRLGKKERVRAKHVNAVIDANLANMQALREEQHLFGGHNRWTRSCANPDRLKVSTRYGYRDNLHGTYKAPPNAGSCRIDSK